MRLELAVAVQGDIDLKADGLDGGGLGQAEVGAAHVVRVRLVEGVLVHIAEGSVVLVGLASAEEADVVLVLGRPAVKHEGAPVGVGIMLRIGTAADGVKGLLAERFGRTVVPRGEVAVGHTVQRVHLARPDAGLGERQVGVVFHRGLSAAADLGCDLDDAVGGPGAVNGRRGRILQNGQGLDVVRGEVAEIIAGTDDAVDDVERITAAADADRRRHVDTAARLDDDQAGGTSGQALGHVGDRDVDDFRGFDGGHGRDQVPPGTRAVTDDDDLVQVEIVKSQDDARVVACVADRQLPGLEADARQFENVSFCGVDGEVAVQVGNDTYAGSLYHDGYTGEGLAVLVNDGTGVLYRMGLCICGTPPHEETQSKHSFENKAR